MIWKTELGGSSIDGTHGSNLEKQGTATGWRGLKAPLSLASGKGSSISASSSLVCEIANAKLSVGRESQLSGSVLLW